MTIGDRNMSEILPCPFCGGEASVVTQDVEPQGDPWYGKKLETFVRCTRCGATLFDIYFHEGFGSKAEAIAAWNVRSPPSGYRLVPVEPTEAMIGAGVNEAHRQGGSYAASAIYAAMLAAAPSPKEGK